MKRERFEKIRAEQILQTSTLNDQIAQVKAENFKYKSDFNKKVEEVQKLMDDLAEQRTENQRLKDIIQD